MNALRQTVDNLIQMNSTNSASKPHICPHCEQEIPKKQIEVFGEMRLVQPKCECEVQATLSELYKLVDADKKARIEKKFSVDHVGKRFLTSTFDNFEQREGSEKALEISRAYADQFEKWEGNSIMIWGEYGNGKSHLAAAVGNELKSKGVIVVFQSVPELLGRIRSTFGRESRESESEIMSALLDCDLLILDDIGAEKVTDWVSDVLFRIIDGRYRKNMPILYTSNLKPSALHDKLGGRIYDRIMETSLPVENKATSFRKEKAKERFKRFTQGDQGNDCS